VEEEFLDFPLPGPKSVVPPLTPRDYPKFGCGDILVTRHRGTFIRPCPATPRYNCCGLNIFHFGQGCDLGCSYCILSAYLGSDALILFGNVKDGLKELSERLDQMSAEDDLAEKQADKQAQTQTNAQADAQANNSQDQSEQAKNNQDQINQDQSSFLNVRNSRLKPSGDDRSKDDQAREDQAADDFEYSAQNLAEKPAYTPSYRFCTGEFTDSLLLDRHTRLSEQLIELFRDRPPFILELKTKTAYVDHLLDLDHGGRTVISFSVNAPFISRLEEPRTAPLETRLGAAAKAAKKGYPIGLHFDPLVHYPGWETGYAQTAELIKRHLDPSMIAFISLGCLRFLPQLKPIMLKTRPSTLFDAEFIRGGDGKMRYPRPVRRLMYQRMLECLTPLVSAETVIYLCMESSRVWKEVFGHDPETQGLTRMFRKR
jgi:DNA repair photolyase